MKPGQSLSVKKQILQILNPSDVGIISPYRRQVQKIRELMQKKFHNKIPNYKDVTVGSTEEFQGQVKIWTSLRQNYSGDLNTKMLGIHMF